MNKKLKKWGLLAAGIGAAVGFAEAVFLEKYFYKIEKYNIGKPGSSKNIRVLFLTDLHFKTYLWPFHYKLADEIKLLNPDLILISGDVIDETGTSAEAAIKFFNLVNYSIPKVAIMGNHDHKNAVDIRAYYQMYKGCNCTLLMNETKVFTIKGERIVVTGVDDYIEGDPSLVDAVAEVGREDNHLLLIHSPKQQKNIKKQIKKINAKRSESNWLNIQYMFAGHNHGGQVTILGYAPVMPEKSGKYVKGWYNKKPPYLYVSNGFGTSTLPFRFGARAEITLFNFGV